MSVYVGNSEIKCVYIGTTPAKAVYVGTTKIRPNTLSIDFLAAAGGGGGGNGLCYSYGGGGGAGGAMYCASYAINKGSYCVIIGCGGCAQYNGGNTQVFGYTLYGGGCGGTACYTYKEAGGNGGSGGGGSLGCNCVSAAGGTACNQAYGKNGGASCRDGAGGGGGYSTAGCQCYGAGGNGGDGLYSDISGTGVYYAAGGGAGGRPGGNSNGGGAGGSWCGNGCNANTCGSGGGGGASTSWRQNGGNGAGGVFIVRYPTACNYNITGGTKYTCGNYTINCFTSSGTLTIN